MTQSTHKTRIAAASVLMLTLLASVPLSASQTASLPPSQQEVEELIDGVDEVLIDNDPTNGLIPSINSVRMNSNVAALTNKLDAYQAALLSGAIAKVPSGQVDFDDVDIQEGFLPNRTLATGFDLLSTLGINQLVEEPLPCVKVSPGGGTVSTTFSFDASCSVDAQTATRNLQTRWDWNGDGTYDTSWATSLTATHSYSSTGTKTPTVQVRDADGNTATASTSVQVSAPPDACFTVSPTGGTTATTFQFDASCSTDDFTATSSLRARWDWNNDGTYDTSWTTAKTASHKYSSAGTKTIKLQVQDGSGLTDTYTRSVSVTYYNGGGGGGCPSGSMSLTQQTSGGYSTPPPEPCTGAAQSASASTGECSDVEDESSACGVPLPNLVGTMSVTPGGFVVDQLEREVDATGAILRGELNRTSIAEPILFQRMPNAPYEPAQDGEAWLAEGASLRLRPAAPPVNAIIDQEWLEQEFDTYGSPSAYTIVYHDGRPHARVTDPGVLLGSKYAFEAIVLGQSTRYTNGHADMVELTERGMQVSFTSYPGFVTTTVAREAPNGTADEQNTTYHEDRLGIDFAGENTTGQTVRLSKEWLDGLGLTMPRFVHEDGTVVPHVLDGAHYVLSPAHFSTLFAENFDSGAAQGWSLTGLWHVTTACAGSYNGAYHLAYNQDSTCTYNTGATTSGTATFDVNLNGVSSPQLTFRHRWTIESYAGTFDVMRVQVSTNGGSSWSTLEQWDSSDGSSGSSTYHEGTWTPESYSLSAYTGSAAKIRFSFASGDAQFNDFLGWLVDDVKVTGTTSNNPPNPCFGRTPSSGTTTTTFSFDASCSSDVEDPKSSLQVRWDWEDDGVYDTVYSTDKTFDHKFSSTGTHTVRMMVRDTNGLTASTTASVSVSQASTGGEGLSSTFESGTDAWSLAGMWHRTSCRAGSGTYSIAYNQGSCSNADYDNGVANSGSATSPSFKVPANLPSLTFKSWFETEGGTSWDKKYVEISTNGGSSWTLLKQINDGQRVWNNHVIALDSYAGKEISIRFRFDSVDSGWNQYEGWYIDEVNVAFNDQIVRYDGEFTHSYVESQSYQWYYRHDTQPETVWRIGDTTDSVRQRFSMSQAPETGEYAYVYVYARSVSCTSTPTLELLVNGQVITQVSTCGWSSSDYGWKSFSIPSNLLKAGNNDIILRGTCSCSAAIDMQTDSSGSGTYTDLVVDGQTRNGYEAFWYLIVGRPSEYETLEQYSTYEYTDANGVRKMEHIQEAYVFNDLEQMDTTYLLQRTLADGRKVYFVSNMEFLKRADYTTQTRYAGWEHWVFNPDGMDAANQGRETPTTNQFYTWFRYDWQYLIPNEDGTAYQSSRGSFIQLVESNPSDPADKQGSGQNPPAYGSSGLNFDVHGEYYIKTCEYSSHKHTPWDPPSHPHDCARFAITLLDLDENTKEYAKAFDATMKIMEWAEPVIQNADMVDWLQKSMKSALKGSLIGWFMSVAQTGDALSLNENERDRFIGLGYTPWTVASTVPTIPGWVFPFDPHTVGHILLWNGNLNLSGQWP